jgi:hypothetical protein
MRERVLGCRGSEVVGNGEMGKATEHGPVGLGLFRAWTEGCVIGRGGGAHGGSGPEEQNTGREARKDVGVAIGEVILRLAGSERRKKRVDLGRGKVFGGADEREDA